MMDYGQMPTRDFVPRSNIAIDIWALLFMLAAAVAAFFSVGDGQPAIQSFAQIVFTLFFVLGIVTFLSRFVRSNAP